MDLTWALVIFAAGLLLFRSAVVRLAAVLFFLLGLSLASSSFGVFVHTLAGEAWRFIT